MQTSGSALARARQFCQKYALRVPVLMAPMAGASPTSLAIAVGNAGGMGAAGVLLVQPNDIRDWAAEVRSATNGAFQLNTWIPDPPPARDPEHESAVRDFLADWGPLFAEDAADATAPDFAMQCEAMLAAGPRVISSIMGVFPEQYVARVKADGIGWFATVTTVAEAVEAQAAGADAVVAQGMEAGGHRGAFKPDDAEAALIGLFSLLPAVVDAVDVPVVAAGGIADARGVAAALTLGASAVQVGTALLRSPEARLNPAWADAIARARPEDTIATRAYSGRLGRSLRTRYAVAASMPEAPAAAPFPIQRSLTSAMCRSAAREGDVDRMSAWAGQSASRARAAPAGEIVEALWQGARELLPRG